MAKYLGKSKESDEKLRKAVRENRKAFNEDFREITAAEVKKLTDKQKAVYDEIKKNENVAAVPKKQGNNLFAFTPSVRLKEFDSETYEKVKPPLISLSKKSRKREMEKRRAEANQFRTNLDFPGASKGYGYPTRINGEQVAGGMRIPKSRIKIAPKESRGRMASPSSEKEGN